MIPRYTRPEMSRIWSEAHKFALWLEIETLAAEAMAGIGAIPAAAAEAIRARGGFDPARIAVIEAEIKHDVLAFLTSVSEHVGPEGRFLHRGMTSSDLLDTGFALQLRDATDLLIAGVDRVRAALRKRAFEHRLTPMIGRSHGMHAEPVTFGLKLAGFYAEFGRVETRLRVAREEISVCALSGPVGTYSEIDPRVEEAIAARLGLRIEPVSTQIIPRDRHAAFFAALALTAGAVERVAVEIRHLQRSEIREVEEFFAEGQKGSSSMPHKRNPVLSENLTGLARLVRGALAPALENMVLWHERDISHSSVERAIAPDATAHLHFALHRLAQLIETLVVYPGTMRANLEKSGGLYHSQAVMLSLTEAGMAREIAYALVQKAAMRAWRGEVSGPDAFRTLLEAETGIAETLGIAEFDRIFSLDRHFAYIDRIFARVFGACS